MKVSTSGADSEDDNEEELLDDESEFSLSCAAIVRCSRDVNGRIAFKTGWRVIRGSRHVLDGEPLFGQIL